MSLSYEKKTYGYFIRGRSFILVQWDGYNWVSPTETVGNESDSDWSQNPKGYLLEYSAVPDVSGITSEESIIPASDILALALVDYVNAKVYEEQGDIKLKEYWMNEFRRKVYKLDSKKTGGLRRISPRPLGSIT